MAKVSPAAKKRKKASPLAIPQILCDIAASGGGLNRHSPPLSLLPLNERGCACKEREKARRNDPSILGSPAAEKGPKRRTYGKPPSSRKAKWREEVYKKEEAKALYNRRTEAENSSLFGG